MGELLNPYSKLGKFLIGNLAKLMAPCSAVFGINRRFETFDAFHVRENRFSNADKSSSRYMGDTS